MRTQKVNSLGSPKNAWCFWCALPRVSVGEECCRKRVRAFVFVQCNTLFPGYVWQPDANSTFFVQHLQSSLFFFFKVQWLKMAFRTGVEIDFSLPTLHDIRPIRRGTLPQKFAHICKLNSQSLGLEVLQQSFLLWEWSMQALILSNVLFAKKNFEVYILWSWEYFTYCLHTLFWKKCYFGTLYQE